MLDDLAHGMITFIPVFIKQFIKLVAKMETTVNKEIKLVLPCALHETHSTRKDFMFCVLNLLSRSKVLF